jgi:membrane protein DedA with SNARE-associated domain
MFHVEDLMQAAQTFLPWITQYGSFALFVLLALGVVALPIPDETLMIIAGFLIAKAKLSPSLTVIAAIAGAITGITISYIIGRTIGHFLVLKYGRWVGLTQAKLTRAHNWFERFGKWTLVIGYFIPGVRHLTGYAAGTLYMHYAEFAAYAYTGAFIWACLFLSLGYAFGTHWGIPIPSVDF